MELLIDLEGRNATAEAAELRDWLHRARPKGLQELRQQEAPPRPGEQGPELLAVLTVILAGPATVALVHTLHRWIEARKPRVRIKITTPEQKIIEIDAENPPSTEELTKQVEALERS
jgi:hypothetical protein